FPGAPSGGAGAPAMVTITDCSFFQYASASAPSQGADIFITGTAAHPSTKIILSRDYFAGARISQAAVKVNFSTNVRLLDVMSNGHTKSTLIIDPHATLVTEEFVTSDTDAARCSGLCGAQVDITQNSEGQ